MSELPDKSRANTITRRNFLRIAGGTLLSFSLPLTVGTGKNTGDALKLRIGGIFSITGPNSPVGRTMRDGAKLAIKQINSGGGIGGKIKLELIVKDGRTSQIGAADAARKLAGTPGVSFVLGPLIGTHGAASQPILAAADIPQIFFGTAVGFTDRHDKFPLSIRFGTQTALQTAPVLHYAFAERNDRELFLLAPSNQQGRDFKRVIERQIDGVPDANLAGSEFYPPFNRDFSTLFAKALNSGSDGLIAGTGIPADLVSLAREFNRQGVDPGKFGYYTGQTPNGSIGFFDQAVKKGFGDGVIYSWHYERDEYKRAFNREGQTEGAKKMESEFLKESGNLPGSLPAASWGWGGIQIINQAITGMMKQRGENKVLAMARTAGLPEKTISYILPDRTELSGPTFETPFGNAGFLGCGQFNVRLGVATFKNREKYLLRDRGYGNYLLDPLCP